ncbi:hypothetical protein NOLU111490_14145 [Novosphingobium lubricantis]|jgi:hypothetical protein|uniref:Uncharacterized protein n=1 Tax=Novosphingobium pentaromativorans US6-1 TaxID=1088721 RepID=G6EJE0_9SPHN|nr:hypothetical protein [Novosphingobium pentaromativorans]EHJ58581.1 hypothetical protein NSU_4461 [Novosphingobium pentaromativorans US6-1]
MVGDDIVYFKRCSEAQCGMPGHPDNLSARIAFYADATVAASPLD